MDIAELRRATFYKKYIAIDTESTGFQPNDNYSRLLEIGAVKIENNKIVDRYDELINPGMKVPKKIVELTGITDEMVADKDNVNSALVRFKKWTEGDYIFIFHNASHDLRFLNHFGEKAGVHFDNPTIDTQTMARHILGKGYWNKINSGIKQSFKLATLAQLFRIPDINHHRADNDAELTWRVYEKLHETWLRKEPSLIAASPWTFPAKTETALTGNGEIKVLRASPWEKGKMKRLYVNLLYREGQEKSFGNVYYDFNFNCWQIKETFFPIENYDVIEKQVKTMFKTDKMEYENFKAESR